MAPKRKKITINEEKPKRLLLAHKAHPSCVEDVVAPPCSVEVSACEPPASIGTWKDNHHLITKISPKQFKVCAWNVNGIRSVLKPHAAFGNEPPLIKYVSVEQPDILCLNETKIHSDLVDTFKDCLPGYTGFFVCSEKKGYAGVATFVRNGVDAQLKNQGLGDAMHDGEGRLQTFLVTPAEQDIPPFYLVNTYVVNAGQGLTRLHYKINSFNKHLYHYLNELHSTHPVMWAGDLNVAHQEIDIWNSKGNQKSAGHTPQERVSFGKFLESHEWVDAFRQRTNLDQNRGWRIDYFVTTKNLIPYIRHIFTRDFVRGSDHCPLVAVLEKAA